MANLKVDNFSTWESLIRVKVVCHKLHVNVRSTIGMCKHKLDAQILLLMYFDTTMLIKMTIRLYVISSADLALTVE